MTTFLNRFDKRDYVHNDHKVGQMLRENVPNDRVKSRKCGTCLKN